MRWFSGKVTPYVFMTAGIILVIMSIQTFFTISHTTSTQEVMSPMSDNAPMKACFVVLVRNSELDGIATTIREIESTFNSKFDYPYVFLNDEEFTSEFIETTSALTKSVTKYGKVDSQMWGYPNYINQTYAAECRSQLQQQGIPYGDSESYRHMCRFQSGFFFRHPMLDEYDYYWRIEPYVNYYCDIDYDVFKYMRNNGKKYGFTIAFREYMATVPTLWQTVMNFRKENPEVASRWPTKKDSLINFVSDNNGDSYNGCHFWTNFEIASLELWRSNDYLKLFSYLDQQGGFFYERWGDAPVHSIAASLMLRKDEFHFFNDIGYRHTAYTHCPREPEFRDKCSCDPASDMDYNDPINCFAEFKKALN
ncbi:nucleotide-diphospho-sugar transferase [Mucor mucedo]|uniref:nucleotide-diphospho-sugar transferase n=1 Tax=Mucor mucedo TaxID=29922 RepID=UPI00221F25EF|nr:nucleotide-diphospho-sugar transferase [Mucor mucedo]KAI7894373.1 nucleotide-diphospho-sugar transferase [Mucor mucedo]